MSDDEIRELIGVLEEANKKPTASREHPKAPAVIEVCLTCKQIIDDPGQHYGHFTVFSDIDHDGIGSTLNALKLVLGEWGGRSQ